MNRPLFITKCNTVTPSYDLVMVFYQWQQMISMEYRADGFSTGFVTVLVAHSR